MKITLAHGSGGRATAELVEGVFAKKFSNPELDKMEDCAVLDGSRRLAVTTDSFVVAPLEFKGGDIGRLCICGTVNDLLMRGAVPKYITCGFIIEEGLDFSLLERIADSAAETAREAGVIIVAGDTKVVEGNGGLYINTAGVGFVDEGIGISASLCRQGDAVVLSGNLGEHHAAILSRRMGIENGIQSDAAPLCGMVRAMLEAGLELHAMRDVTRGGLGTVLNELAAASGCGFEIDEEKIPVSSEVEAFAKILGLDIMHMGNEGKLIAVLPKEQAERAREIMRGCPYGANAAVIGLVTEKSGVSMRTRIGGRRSVSELIGEGLPRIC
ncbi:MAG: hydrogenase expression/formation protein HypE [Butyrivibrio sp.]|nr:hydrogenase expression/formation protein HypE [Butyrivibrio sp.]